MSNIWTPEDGGEHPLLKFPDFMKYCGSVMASNASSSWNVVTSIEQMRETLSKMEAFGKEFREKRKKNLARIAEIECDVCGRKVTPCEDAMGDKLVVCPHVMRYLRKRCPQADSPARLLGPHPFYGIRIEEFDDGPRRF